MAETIYTSGDLDWEEVQHYALFSGGHDSLAATHYAMEHGSTEAVLHIDTGTGIPENRDHVIGTCEAFGWPLRIIETEEDYVEVVKNYGFPGPQLHYIMYHRLKAMPLRDLASEGSATKHFWSGVRQSESQRRMVTKTKSVDYDDEIGCVWVSTILDWDDDDVNEYIEEQDLPENPVVNAIHRSGECLCGAYAYRDEELVDLQAKYPEHYEWLMDVERQVIEERGRDDHTSYWGHGEQSSDELRRLAEQYDELDMKLCRSCKVTQDPHEW